MRMIIFLTIFLTSLLPSQAMVNEQFLNSFIQEYNNKRSFHLGPNCFATALAATNVLPYSGYVDGKQMQLLMESPLCKKVAPQEDLKRGDILLVFTQEKGKTRTPVHTAVYLEEDRVFEKASNATSSRPEIKSIVASLAPYTNDDIVTLRNNKSDKAFVGAYRCGNFRNYLQTHYQAWYKKHQRVIHQLFLRDERVAKMVQTRVNNPDAIRMTVTSLSASLRSLQFIGADQSFDYPHRLGMKEKIWAEAPADIRLIFQMRYTDMIFQVQNLLYSNILSNQSHE